MRFSSALFASLAAQAAFAAVTSKSSIPVKAGLTAVDVGISVVGGVRGSVKAEGALTEIFVKKDLVNLAKTSLGIISQHMKSIKEALAAYVVYVLQPLVESELARVLALAARTQELVEDIQVLVEKLLSGGSNPVTKAMAIDIKAVLAAVKLFTLPVTTLCKTLTGPSTSGTARNIDFVLGTLDYAAGRKLDPLWEDVNELV